MMNVFVAVCQDRPFSEEENHRDLWVHWMAVAMYDRLHVVHPGNNQAAQISHVGGKRQREPAREPTNTLEGEDVDEEFFFLTR